MKKITKITIAIMAFFCLMISHVSAKEIFHYNWENKKMELMKENGKTDSDGNALYQYEFADNNYPFKDGYVTGRISLNQKASSYVLYSYLTKYDSNGKEEKTLTINDALVFSIKSDKDYLYAFVVAPKYNKDARSTRNNNSIDFDIQIIKINENMEKVAKIDLTDTIEEEMGDDSSEYLFLLISLIPKVVGYDNIAVTDDEIAILYSYQSFLVVDKDEKKVEVVEMNTKNFKKYFPNKFTMIENVADYILAIAQMESGTPSPKDFPESLQISIDSNDTNSVGSGVHFVMGLPSEADNKYGIYIEDVATGSILDTEINSNTYFMASNAFIEFYTSKGKTLWKYESTDYAAFLDTHIINDYVVTIGINIELSKNTTLEKINTDILVFDLEGNIVQTISDDSFYLGLFPSENGFIATNIGNINEIIKESTAKPSLANLIFNGEYNMLDYANILDVGQAVGNQNYDTMIETKNVVYNLLNKIDTKIEGKGNVEVIDTSKTGEEVTFKVQPEKGYVLKAIKVTDKEGNTITLTDYTFTMPSSDVTIEATFVPENPDTVDIAIITIATISIVSVVIILKKKNKLNWLK